jgi:hypothetical protein
MKQALFYCFYAIKRCLLLITLVDDTVDRTLLAFQNNRNREEKPTFK